MTNISENLDSDRVRKKFEDLKYQQMLQASMPQAPQVAQGQAQNTAADITVKILTNPDWLVSYNAANVEDQVRMMANVQQTIALATNNSGGGNNMNQMLPPPHDDATAATETHREGGVWS